MGIETGSGGVVNEEPTRRGIIDSVVPENPSNPQSLDVPDIYVQMISGGHRKGPFQSVVDRLRPVNGGEKVPTVKHVLPKTADTTHHGAIHSMATRFIAEPVVNILHRLPFGDFIISHFLQPLLENYAKNPKGAHDNARRTVAALILAAVRQVLSKSKAPRQ